MFGCQSFFFKEFIFTFSSIVLFFLDSNDFFTNFSLITKSIYYLRKNFFTHPNSAAHPKIFTTYFLTPAHLNLPRFWTRNCNQITDMWTRLP